MQPATPRPIEERHGLRADTLGPELLASDQPLVLRGVVADWPIARAGAASAQEAVAYLRRFARPDPVVATVAAPETGGRFFYTDGQQGFNFRQERVPLPVVLDTLLGYLHAPAPPAIYVGSTTIDTWLPGFRAENDLDLGARVPLASIWIGNRTRIAAHQDIPDNIACVVAGRRRVTLFPPEQLANLYIGPLDRTPAGQAISLVDFAAPDFEAHPRFAEALRHAQVAVLEPGDAVLIPSLWWHHMEGLAPFNILVNYWWRRSPAYMDSPMNALMLALLSVRDLPAHEREHWREVFRHYVFDADAETVAHIAPEARGALAPMDDTRARELRARLLQRLNR
ncbi:cupin-like domain-containing protein [Pseudoxanthomonas winnipegensis]|uniref:Cupin-like domain-containing protein n=1 Tax=Pseudoxanthomonas winnipegensis TaxID=2480810 RepID=A0A4Q8LMU3_9GAMM|nr:cupin-like domain-containing protein [Pseudoxanthomonas winnipegensis]RZZ84046.1 cupin-like domain-containing protein [Pseudoxanthomonas winnipegensis]TAA32188.1 cupin-like domain-containing protein [Pseudoxanthomonas winnipegensis]